MGECLEVALGIDNQEAACLTVKLLLASMRTCCYGLWWIGSYWALTTNMLHV